MKKIIFLIAILASFTATSQDEAVFGHYHQNPVLINPAASGFENNYKLNLHARSQWAGFDDAPNTVAFSFSGPLGKSFGLSALIMNEQVASLSRSRIQIGYAFKYKVQQFNMALGFSTDFENESISNSIYENGLLEKNDNLINRDIDGYSSFDAAVGLYGNYNEETYFGLTFSNLVSARLSDITTTSSQSSLFDYFSFNLKHKLASNRNAFTLEPSILVRKVRNAPFLIDFNLIGGFLKEKIITGLSYHAGAGGGFGLILGTSFNNIRLVYSYDVGFNGIQTYNLGTHEITVGFDFVAKSQKVPSNEK